MIGTLLHKRFDVSLQTLVMLDNTEACISSREVLSILEREHELTFDGDAIRLLDYAQGIADGRGISGLFDGGVMEPWVEAQRIAQELIEEHGVEDDE